MVQKADPDAAPRCPGCGYNLFGLPHLRCPECGKEVTSLAELEQARWLATRNAADRQAILVGRCSHVLGGIMLGVGVVLNVLHLGGLQGFRGYFTFREIGAGLVLTWLALSYLHDSQGAGRWTLLILGTLWFISGLYVWFVG